jgi:choice-of-anchor C domain-containing protein
MKTLILIVSLAILSASSARANLIMNGSFELGIPEQNSVPVGSTGITGWTVTRDQIDLVGSYWSASDGVRSLDLNGTPGVGGIAQSFSTVPGHIYDVQFDQAANPSLGGRISTMAVTAAGQTANFSFDDTGDTFTDMGWVRRDWEFNAVDSSTTLEFYSLDTSNPNYGPALDHVVVTDAVPEPSSLALLGIGGITLLRCRRNHYAS